MKIYTVGNTDGYNTLHELMKFGCEIFADKQIAIDRYKELLKISQDYEFVEKDTED